MSPHRIETLLRLALLVAPFEGYTARQMESRAMIDNFLFFGQNDLLLDGVTLATAIHETLRPPSERPKRLTEKGEALVRALCAVELGQLSEKAREPEPAPGQVIFKYPLNHGDYPQLPAGAQPISVGCQGSTLVLWALVNPGAELRTRRIRIFGTGHECDTVAGRFLGTVQMPSGLVWHVFDCGEIPT